MTIGIGGSDAQQELACLSTMALDIAPIGVQEYQQRIEQAQALLQQAEIAALYIDAGTNLHYFIGVS